MPVSPSGARRRLISGHAAAAVLLLSSLSTAQTNADELARRHFESGVAYLEESDLENALKAFEKAYALSKRPAILLNIANVHERRGDIQAAIAALRGYLDAEPGGEHAETTKLRLQNLEKRAAEAAAAAPPSTPTATEPAAPPPVAAAPSPPPPPVAEPAKPNRLPAYAAFGVGGAGLLTAVVTGLVANGEYQSAKDECSPNCSEDEVSTGRTLALVSTIATGIAVAGIGLGVTLLLTEPDTTTGTNTARSTASLSLRVTADGLRSSASLRF